MAVTLCPKDECPQVFTLGPQPLFIGKHAFKCPPPIKYCDIMICAPLPVGFYACRPESFADVCFIPQLPEEPILFFNVYCPGEEVCEEAPVAFFNVYEVCEEPAKPPVTFVVAESTEDEPVEPVLFFNVYNHEECP